MGLLQAIEEWLNQKNCKPLVKIQGKSIDIGAIGAEYGDFKVNVGKIKVKDVALQSASRLLKFADGIQVINCKWSYRFNKGDPFLETIYFHQSLATMLIGVCEGIVAISVASNGKTDITKALEEWIEQANETIAVLRKIFQDAAQKHLSGAKIKGNKLQFKGKPKSDKEKAIRELNRQLSRLYGRKRLPRITSAKPQQPMDYKSMLKPTLNYLKLDEKKYYDMIDKFWK